MKKRITILALLLSAMIVKAQNLDWYSYWGSSTAGSQIEPVNMAIDSDGDLYVATLFGGDQVSVLDETVTSTASTDKGDALITKVGSDETKIWQHALAGTSASTVEISQIIVDNDDNLIVAGTFTGTLQGDSDSSLIMEDPSGYTALSAFIIRYDSDGNVLRMWQLPSEELTLDGVAVDSSNNIILSGTFGSEMSFDPNDLETMIGSTSYWNQYFVAKYTYDGELMWSKYSQSNEVTFTNTVVTTDDDANVYIGGTFTGTVSFASTSLETTSGVNDLFIGQLSSDGTENWAKRIGGSRNDVAVAIETSPFGDVAICCSYYSEDITITGSSDTYDNGFVDLDADAVRAHLAVFTFKQNSGDYRWWYSFGAGSTTGSGQAEGDYLRCTDEGVWYVGGMISWRYGDLFTYDNFGNYKSGMLLSDGTWVQHNTNGGSDAVYLVLNREGIPCSIARPGAAQTERMQDVILSPDKKSVYMLYNINVRDNTVYTCVDNLWDSYTDITTYDRDDDYTMLQVYCPEDPTDGEYSDSYKGIFASTILAKYDLPALSPNELPEYVDDSIYGSGIEMSDASGKAIIYSMLIADSLTYSNDSIFGTLTGTDTTYCFGFTAIDSTALPGTINYYAQDASHLSIRGNSRNVRYMLIKPEGSEEDSNNDNATDSDSTNTDDESSSIINQNTYDIAVYPTVCSDNLTIETNATSFTVTIYNHAGILVDSYKNTTSINVNNYQTGLYFISIQTSDGNYITKKVLIE